MTSSSRPTFPFETAFALALAGKRSLDDLFDAIRVVLGEHVGCHAVVFLRAERDSGPRETRVVYAHPADLSFDLDVDVVDLATESHSSSPTEWHRRGLAPGDFRHLFVIPNYGLLDIRKHALDLEHATVTFLCSVLPVLGDAIAVCDTQRRESPACTKVTDPILFEGTLAEDGGFTIEALAGASTRHAGSFAQRLIGIPDGWLELIAPQDRAAARARIINAGERGEPFQLPFTLSGAATGVQMEMSGSPLLPVNDQPATGVTRWLGGFYPRALQQHSPSAPISSTLPALLDEVLPDANVGTDDEGRIVYFNPRAEQLFGHRREAVLGKPVTILIPKRFQDAHERGMRMHRDTGASSMLGRLVHLPAMRADGEEFAAEFRLTKVVHDGLSVFFGAFRDVTQPRQNSTALSKLHTEERKFGEVLLELARMGLDDFSRFEAALTSKVASVLSVDRVSLWGMGQGALECLDAYLLSENAHVTTPEIPLGAIELYWGQLEDLEVLEVDDFETFTEARLFHQGDRSPLGFCSALHMPVRTISGIKGVLCLESRRARPWRPPELNFVQEVCQQFVQVRERAARMQLEARHAAILSSIGDAVIACDADSRITLMNRTAARLTGYAADQAVGASLHDVFRLEGEPTRFADLMQSASTGEAVAVTRDQRVQIVCRDGSRLPISQSISPIMDVTGVQGMVITFRDISAEEETRRALEQQNEELRSIHEAIPDLLFAVSADGRIHYSQHDDHPDLLVPPDEIPVITVHSIFDPQLAERVLAAVRRCLSTGQVERLEYTLKLPQGVQTFEARVSRMHDDVVTVLVRNITEERQRSLALEIERSRLEQVLSTTSAVIYSARLPDFEVDYISDSVQSVLGFAPEEVTRSDYWTSVVHPEDLPRVLQHLNNLRTSGALVHEYRHRHKSGGYRWVRDEVRLILDNAGEPVRAVGASFDITERKVSELRLTRLLSLNKLLSETSTTLLGETGALTPEILQAALQGVAKQAQADRVVLAILDGPRFSDVIEWNHSECPPMRASMLDLSATDYALSFATLGNGVPFQVHDASTLPDAAARIRDVYVRHQVESVVAVPLLFESAFHGFIEVHNPRIEPLHHEDFASLLQVFADSVAAAMQRVENDLALRALNTRLTGQATKQRALLQLSEELARAHSHDELFALMQRRLRQVLGVARISFAETNPAENTYTLSFVYEPDATTDAERPGSIQEPLPRHAVSQITGTAIEEAIRRNAPISTQQFPVQHFKDWHNLHAEKGLNHFIVVPMLHRQSVVGTLNVAFRTTEHPTMEEVDWVSQFASLMGAHMAIHDGRDALKALNSELEQRVESRSRELLASEERFETLFQQAPQAMIIVDASNQVVQSNQNAQQLFGYADEDFAQLPVEQLIPPALRAGHSRLMDGFHDGGTARAMGKQRIVSALRKSGETFAAEIGLVPLSLSGTWHVLAGINDVSERRAAELAVTASLREKETLLKEIHHRVKNNLQIISSLLMLQSEQVPSAQARALFEESVFRVRSMALIHEQLYGVESLSSIDLSDYARALAATLQTALAPTSRIEVHADVAEVSIDVAIPLGLILNEFLTNAFKYGIAAPGEVGRTGEGCDVLVEIVVSAEKIRVVVTDSGRGLPDDFDPMQSKSLGLQLVRSLNRQLRGTLSFDSDRGARFVIECPTLLV